MFVFSCLGPRPRGLRLPVGLTIAVTISPLLAGGCSLVGDGQIAPPELGKYDSLSVVPGCVVLDAQSSSAPDVTGSAQTNSSGQQVTIIGKRQDGTGAESVRVDVSVGPCGESTTDAGALQPAPACTLGSHAVSDSIWSRIELFTSDGGNCQSQAPQLVSCRLSPDGFAVFGIRPVAPVRAIVGGYIPVCVNAKYDTANAGALQRRSPITVPVYISQGVTDDYRLSFSSPFRTSPQQSGTPDCSRIVNCSQPLVNTFQLTLEAPESNDAGIGSYSPKPTDRILQAVVNVAPADGSNVPAPSINAGPGCATTTGASAVVTIPAGSAASQSFTVCAYNQLASYDLTAVLVNQPTVSGQLKGVPVTPDIASITARPTATGSSTWSLRYSRCGESASQALDSSLVQIPPSAGEFTTSIDNSGALTVATVAQGDAGTGTAPTLDVTIVQTNLECTLELPSE